jgi:hypothetical protein
MTPQHAVLRYLDVTSSKATKKPSRSKLAWSAFLPAA